MNTIQQLLDMVCTDALFMGGQKENRMSTGKALKIVLPYRGEFGHKLMKHVPRVHALAGPKVVCCEWGNEALYPTADELHLVGRAEDRLRRENMRQRDAELYADLRILLREKYPEATFVDKLRPPGTMFIPRPRVLRGIKADVVVCPRFRRFGALKNWDGWPDLVGHLTKEYENVWAIGSPDASMEVPCHMAWHFDSFLNLSLEALLTCKFVVATDTGLAYLAVLCGKPVYFVTFKDGKSGPGYAGINWSRYAKLNHMDAKLTVLPDTWSNGRVAWQALRKEIT